MTETLCCVMKDSEVDHWTNSAAGDITGTTCDRVAVCGIQTSVHSEFACCAVHAAAWIAAEGGKITVRDLRYVIEEVPV